MSSLRDNYNLITIPPVSFEDSGGGITLQDVQNEISTVTGWGDYIDTQYTELSPLIVPSNTDTKLPNNGTAIAASQLPDGESLYDNVGQVITGRNGDAVLITVEMKVVPQAVQATLLSVWVDIGLPGGVRLYERPVTFPRGLGEAQPVTFTTGAYTLDTWQANGGEIFLRGNGAFEIYDIRFIIFRLHKSRL